MIDDPPVRRREMDETLDEIDPKGYRLPWPTLVGIAVIFGLLAFLVAAVSN